MSIGPHFFSVVLCVNKDDGFLGEAIDSVLKQDYSSFFEFIIVANNCTDELFSSLSNYSDDRLKVYRTSVGQLCFNLNYALDRSTGQYIVRMDADDLALPRRLATLERSIVANNYPDVIGTAVNFVDQKGCFIKVYQPPLSESDIRKKLFFKNPFVHPSVAIKRVSLLAVGGYSGGFQSEDMDLWIRLCRTDKYRLVNIEDITLSYRLSGTQARGSRLAYCEVAGYSLREFVYSRRIKWLFSVAINVAKSVFLPKR